jgi:hypothetical protein
MRKVSGFICAVVLIVALAACGASNAQTSASQAAASRTVAVAACTQVGTKHFAKTRFLLHAGLGIGAFRHFVYTPFKAGKFKSGAQGRVKAMIIAGAAALFTYHELKTAKKFAEANKTLCKLVAPIDKLTAALPSLGSGLKSGKLNDAGINGAAQNVASFKGSATRLGTPITERVPPSVGVP